MVVSRIRPFLEVPFFEKPPYLLSTLNLPTLAICAYPSARFLHLDDLKACDMAGTVLTWPKNAKTQEESTNSGPTLLVNEGCRNLFAENAQAKDVETRF